MARVLAAVATLLAVLLCAAPADAGVRLVRADRAEVLAAGALTVKVTGSKRVRVAVRPRGIARARTVRAPRVVELRLTARGRRLVRTCRVSKLQLRAGKARRRVTLRRPCAAPATPGGGTGASGTPGGTPGGPGTSAPAAGSSGAPSPDPTVTPSPTPGGGGGGGGGGTPLPDVLTGLDAPGCDPFDRSACMLPFPNDLFTKPDPGTATGRRLDLPLVGMPRNVAGRPIDPEEYNRADGFSPGTPIVVRVPGIETPAHFRAAGLVRQTDLVRAYDPEQPVLLIDAATRERQLVWAELDSNASTDRERVLIIRPAKNLREGRRYIVALRNLPVAPDPAFRLYRDRIRSLNPLIEQRRDHMEDLLGTLELAGVERSSLHLAWDFTTASARDRTERARWMRDQAFAELGDTDLADLQVQGRPPAYEVTSVTDDPDPRIARIVEGTVTVPCFLDQRGCPPGSTFAYENRTALLPRRTPGNTTEAAFRCIVPEVALTQRSARPSLYGHGLFGSRSEVGQGQLKSMAQEHDMVFCATDWIGMSTAGGVLGQETYGDLPFIATALLDLSNFPVLADRVQQGLLNFMFVGRALLHPDGFAEDPAFQDAEGRSLLDHTRLYYDGNSQGGIIGGALIALSPDAERGVLGVPGMNYSTLLNRSVDFETDPARPCPPTDPSQLDPSGVDPADPESFLELLNFSYACPMYLSYPDEGQRQLVFALIQQLWDRAEANGYALHMTGDPLPNTPPHEVLMHVGLGDHQVAQVSAEVEARTIGAATRPSPVEPDRSFDEEPLYGIPRIGAHPFAGSAIEIWDSGRTPVAPAANVPPREGEDPHEEPRNTVAAREQKSAFLRPGGKVVDTCAGAPCHSRLK